MSIIQWVVAISLVVVVGFGSAQGVRVAQQQLVQAQQQTATTAQHIEHYKLQLQLQRHRQFLLWY